jgi:transposase
MEEKQSEWRRIGCPCTNYERFCDSSGSPKRSHREVARSVGVSPGAIASALTRARAHALTWAQVETLTEEALERQLYGPRARDVDGCRPEPDLAWMHQELRRPGVTLELLHVEYLAQHPTGYRYSGFCRRYQA